MADIQREEMAAVPRVTPVADPGALGLGGFALTTFVLSAHNIGAAPDLIWIGLALFYGGLGQFLAGQWEFKNRNVFGATAFSTYGAFWMALATFVLLVLFGKVPVASVEPALAWFVFAFLVFNSYMLINSLRVNVAVFLVFLFLELTEIALWIGYWQNQVAGHGLILVGGILGIITAIVAWYASFATVANNMGRTTLPVGTAIWTAERV